MTDLKSYRILLSIAVILLAAVCVLLVLQLYKPDMSPVPDGQTVTLHLPVYSDDPVHSDVQLLASYTSPLTFNAELTEALREGLFNCESSISIADFHIPYSDEGIVTLQNSMSELIFLDADVFFIDPQNYNVSIQGGDIVSVIPTYLFVGNELTAARNDLKARLNAILNRVDPGFSDLEKALFLHDYLAENFEYDTTLENHNPYIMLTSGVGVCQAYTALYAELLSRCGIESTYVKNDAINHIWNGIQIGGQSYHVDVTWDDSVGKSDGKVGHYFFLLSDDGLRSPNAPDSHGNGWQSRYTFQSTTYDQAFFKTAYSAFKYVAPYWYVIDEGMYLQKCSSYLTDPVQVLKIFNGVWKRYGSSVYYSGPFSGLGLNGDLLYYNTTEAIMSYNTGTGEVNSVYIYTDGGGYIYGSHVFDSVLYYTIGTTPDPENIVSRETLTLTLDDTVWQNQYQYELDDALSRIVLTKYKGSGKTLTVPASAAIGGKYYRTVLGPAAQKIDSIWYNSDLESLTFESGVIAAGDMSYQFYQMAQLSSLDVTGLITSDMANISHMFQYCSALTDLDLSTWDLSGLTDAVASPALLGCTALDTIRTPLRLALTIQLPNSDFRVYNPSTGKFTSDRYSSLPTSQTDSLYLKRDKRPEPVVSLSNVTKTYDGQAISVPTCSTQSDGKKTFKYYSDPELQNSISRPKAAGVYYAVVTTAETASYLAGTSNTATLTINQASLIISVPSKTKAYGESDPLLIGTVTGLKNGEQMPITYSREPGEAVGTYRIIPNYTATDNYKVTEIVGTLTITAQSLTAASLTLEQTRFTYDRTEHEPGVTLTLSDRVLEPGTDYTVTYTDNTGAGSAKATVTGTGNYSGTLYKFFTIEKALVTIRADSLEKAVGDPDPVLTGVISGLCEGDDLHVTYSRTEGETVGSYSITPSYTENPNYVVAVYRGNLVIHRAEAIPITGAEVTLDQTSFVYSGTEQKPSVKVVLNEETLREGIDYQLDFSDPVHAGTVTVTVTGIDSYQGQLFRNYTIGKATFRITVRDETKTYGDPDPDFSTDVEGLCPGDTYTCDYIRSPGAHVGKYPVTVNVQISADYIVSAVPGLLTIAPAELVVKTESAERIFNGEPLTAPGKVEGLKNDETVTLKMTGSRTDIGASDNTFELIFDGTAVQTDYTVRSELGKLTVLKAPETEPETETQTETDKPSGPSTETETVPWNRETYGPGAESEKGQDPGHSDPETDGKVKDILSRALGCGSTLSPASGILLSLALALGSGLILALRKKES